MSFLSVLFAYVLSRYTDAAAWLQHDNWFRQGLDRLATKHPSGSLPFFALVVGVSALAGVLTRVLPFGIGFLASIVVLLYSLGRNPWRDYIANTLDTLRTGNAETVWLSLESEGYLDTGHRDGLWMAIRKHAAYSYLNDLFSVFFWFCLLGSAGAVFTCLLNLYNRHPAVRNGQIPAFTHWQYALEWLPARYMGLCFCLAGNFNSCFLVWRQLAMDTQLDTREFLYRCLTAALVLEDSSPADEASAETASPEIDLSAIASMEIASTDQEPTKEITQAITAQSLRYGASLEDLLKRTEMIGLVGLALAVLLLS